ncbi:MULTISPECIES: DUF4145 domain-containing protein [Enterobacter]|uniref:DUF4145 domain-containing protein n=1 Tax=Enterobacter TaxID=547 RepID=UPI002005C36C|nr:MULTISPECIES: DUF4145 domain-containing protein [Enterobacter]MCK6894623.1 DUF4145 domain-containing protein [Enterobacter bugandensis]MCK7419818.1 DUF4145 domain-containing protein [Enterobacter asburiae]
MAMMSIDIDCPHCLKERAVMRFINQAYLKQRCYSLVFQCNSCFKLLVAEVETDIQNTPNDYAESQFYPVIINNNPRFKVLSTYPSKKIISAPEATPDRAAKFFIEAKDDFARGRYETSAMNCRKVIDIATKTLHLKEEDKLVRRISALRDTGLITQEMADWAHIVRIDTNGAVHSDEEFTADEVDQLLKFTEVFLTYSFTLPAMVKAKREPE